MYYSTNITTPTNTPISIGTKKPRPQEQCSCGRGRYYM